MLTSPPILPTFDEATSEETDGSSRGGHKSEDDEAGVGYLSGTSGYLLDGKQQGGQGQQSVPSVTTQESETASKIDSKAAAAEQENTKSKQKRWDLQKEDTSVNDRLSSSAKTSVSKEEKQRKDAQQQTPSMNVTGGEDEAQMKNKQRGRGNSSALDRFKWF
jgi:hypothetical protein